MKVINNNLYSRLSWHTRIFKICKGVFWLDYVISCNPQPICLILYVQLNDTPDEPAKAAKVSTAVEKGKKKEKPKGKVCTTVFIILAARMLQERMEVSLIYFDILKLQLYWFFRSLQSQLLQVNTIQNHL